MFCFLLLLHQRATTRSPRQHIAARLWLFQSLKPPYPTALSAEGKPQMYGRTGGEPTNTCVARRGWRFAPYKYTKRGRKSISNQIFTSGPTWTFLPVGWKGNVMSPKASCTAFREACRWAILHFCRVGSLEERESPQFPRSEPRALRRAQHRPWYLPIRVLREAHSCA